MKMNINEVFEKCNDGDYVIDNFNKKWKVDEEELKQKYFDNSKKLGLHPRRRCFCGNIAKWRCVDIFGNTNYLCDKHKEEREKDRERFCKVQRLNSLF